MAEAPVDVKVVAPTPAEPTSPPVDPVTKSWVRAAFAGLVLAAGIYGLKRMEAEDKAREAEEEEDEDEN